MAAIDNNLRVPPELLHQAERIATTQGRSADDLAADALKRYLTHEWLNKIEREGQERRHRQGLRSDEDVEAVVERAIAESRQGKRSR